MEGKNNHTKAIGLPLRGSFVLPHCGGANTVTVALVSIVVFHVSSSSKRAYDTLAGVNEEYALVTIGNVFILVTVNL